MAQKDQAHLPENRLPGLDALRAVAAAGVVVMHIHAIWPEFPDLAGYAYLAVDFFFTLSGFVMARTYEVRLRAGYGGYRFFRARVKRLWPVMAVGAVLALPFAWRDHPDLVTFLAIAVPNMLLLPTFAVVEIFGLNLPAWSIFFELFANAMHGLVLARIRTGWLALLNLLLLIVLAVCARYYGSLDLGSLQGNVLGGLARVAFTYTLGILLWRLFGDRAPLPVPPLLALLAMPVLFSLPAWYGPLSWRLDLAFVVAGCPLILWGGLRMRGFRRVAGAAGALSFPLYAVHYPLLLGAEALRLLPLAGLAVALAGGAAVAWLFAGVDLSSPITSKKPA